MNQEEKTQLTDQYVRTCARLGETIIAQEIAALNVADYKAQAKELLDKIKNSRFEPTEPGETK